MKGTTLCMAIVMALAAGAARAQSFTIDFGDGPSNPAICSGANSDGSGPLLPCSANQYLNRSYGDLPGLLDVTYTSLIVPGSPTLHWYGPNYNDLWGVAYASGGDPNSHGRIELRPLSGAAIDLTHFDLGAWSNTTRTSSVQIFEIGGSTALYSVPNESVGSGSTSHDSFFPDLAPSTVGFWLEWHHTAYNVGIDNIDFEISGVIPEPQTYALLLSGLALLGFAGARRTTRRA